MKPAAVVFDLFGTLLDIASLRTAAAEYTDHPAPFVALWREKQIAYAFAATIMQHYEDFDAITERALAYAAARYARDVPGRAWTALSAQWRAVTAYPDAAASLAALRAAGVPCIVLTNGTLATANAALAAAGFTSAIDAVLSVDAVRVYKPDRRAYGLVTAQLGVGSEQVVFVTANGWDATGAAEFGMRVAWCNRLAAPAETLGNAPEWTIPDLYAVPALAGAAPER